jgi:hypothetical protein
MRVESFQTIPGFILRLQLVSLLRFIERADDVYHTATGKKTRFTTSAMAQKPAIPSEITILRSVR